jgi:hypothetical protein
VAFFDADTVVFAETNNPSFKTISVVDSVIPAGIYMSNSLSAFAFEGAGSIGSCPMTKDGTANFTNNVNSAASVLFKGGTLAGSGNLGGLTVYTNAIMSYAGSINGPLTVNGGGMATLLSGGFVNNTFSIQANGVFTNLGTVQGGSLTVSSNGFLVNASAGFLKNVGNATVSGTLLNIGNIGAELQANTITVNGTFKDMGVGLIYLTQLTINGTFLPGGDGIGTTDIKSSLVGATFNGRLLMQPGSTTVIKVDFANAQTNTVVAAQFTDFGGSAGVKNYNGCTLLMTNINTGAGVFALGQSFRAFTGPSGADIGATGTGTNTYPSQVIPIIPAANTKWDLANLRDTSPNGILNIISYPTTGTNITFSLFKDGTNVVTHLQWPTEYIGWSLQQQTNSLTVGLSTNWTLVSGSTTTNDLYITNDAAIDTTFYRMVYP